MRRYQQYLRFVFSQLSVKFPVFGTATLIGHPLSWEGFFFLSAAVAMATHRVDDDGLKVYSVLPPINPPPKTCSVTLITEIYTENVLQSLFIKTQNRREMTVCVCVQQVVGKRQRTGVTKNLGERETMMDG